MSRPMSPPQSRRFPWDEHGPDRASAEQYGTPLDWRPISRDEERRFGEDMFPEGQRRFPPPQDPFWREQEGDFLRRPSPPRDFKDHRVPSGSPQRDDGPDAGRPRRGFQSFDSRGRSPSPPRFRREPLPLLANNISDHSQGAPGWRRDAEWRGQGRFRDGSPGVRSEEQRGSRREKSAEGLNRSRQREDVQPLMKRPRRESGGQPHSGFRRDIKDFGDQRYSFVMADGDFRGDPPALGAPHFTQHAQGFQDNRKGPRREHLDNGGERDVDMRHERAGPASSSREQFQTSSSRSDVREDSRNRHFADNWRDGSESKRSPPAQDRANFARFDRHGAPTNQRGRGDSHPARGRASHNGNQTNFQKASRSYQNPPREEPGAGYRSQRDACYSNAEEEDEEPSWTEDDRRLEQVGPAGGERRLHRSDLDVERPGPREWEEPDSKSMTVVTEETLTIKVDMSRPALHISSLCYSAERQLSVDLVNVGRQRLDLLPDGSVPEGDGTHGGAFAQEIITLVHNVKERYFKGDGVTLNKRFSVQRGGYGDDDAPGLTLNQRFSSNHMNTRPDEIQPLVPGLRGAQASHGPGDLRHDLERRRQKRLEGVTVTILGSGQLAPADVLYGGADGMFPDERDYRRDGHAGPRRGGPNRMNAGPAPRFKNRQPARMQSRRHNDDEGKLQIRSQMVTPPANYDAFQCLVCPATSFLSSL